MMQFKCQIILLIILSIGLQCYGSTVNTTVRLANLRYLFSDYSIDGYIVPSEDAHQSEYISDCDERREYISGLSGSTGIAVVTADKAAIWTDGRYWEQAETQLDCNWILMKQGEQGVPSMIEWITAELSDNGTIGVDPHLLSASTFIEWETDLEKGAVILKPVDDNLVDAIWDDRPPCSTQSLEVISMNFSGKSWEDKILEVRDSLKQKSVDGIVISTLDEVAWLLNLRGRDIPYNPVFFSHLVVTPTQVDLFVDKVKITEKVVEHLKVENCSDSEDVCVNLHEYEDLDGFLSSQTWSNVWLPSKYSYSGGVSYATYQSIKIEEENIKTDASPVIYTKEKKNLVERTGMRRAHVKDAIAFISFMAMLEEEINTGNYWTELSASAELSNYRSQQHLCKGDSFESVIGYASNGAIIHYAPTPETNKQILNDSLLLIDSGGQYLDGTTDVTRTFHFGEPSVYQKQMYTEVLKGVIDLAMLELPVGTANRDFDIISRVALYKSGKNFHHGIAHGIGVYLNVHESSSQTVTEHYFGSHEPGYYETGMFGIRIENIVETIFLQNTSYGEFLGFRAATLVPMEPKLTNYTLLSSEQISWLNDYNTRIREETAPELAKLNDNGRALAWMLQRTQQQPLQ